MSNHVILMENRQLIPRWHTSRKSMALQFPTLMSKTSSDTSSKNDKFLEKVRANWRQNKNYYNAVELHTALLVRGIYSAPDDDEAISFLLSKQDELPSGAKHLIEPSLKHIDKSSRYYTYLPTDVGRIISRLRSIVTKFPQDYMTWCDLAFYYTVLGLNIKAEKCLSIAWNQCESHPYIARCFARFYVHIGEPEKATWLLKKSGGVNYEPLITSASIAISCAFGFGNPDISKARKLLGDYRGLKAFSSELAATIGTVEFNNGRKKKAKGYFTDALEQPSENSLSQYKWLNQKSGFTLNDNEIAQPPTVEGNVHQLYVQGNFEECRDKLLDLFDFQPFSDAPISDAGYMSLVGLNDPDFVIELSDTRIPKTHMSFGELNNLTVAKLMKNDLSGAEVSMRLLSKKLSPDKPESQGIYLATSGLVMFKLGQIEKGNELYKKAISFFESRKEYRSVALAEHYFSMCAKGVDDTLYDSLRKSVEKRAKALGMRELSVTTNKTIA